MSRLPKSERERMKAESIAWLRKNVPQGSAVFTILTHVSRSGMSRNIKCLILHPQYGIDNISYHVARALELPHVDRDSAIRVSGCGMDMGFHLISSLAYALDYRGDSETNAHGLNHYWL